MTKFRPSMSRLLPLDWLVHVHILHTDTHVPYAPRRHVVASSLHIASAPYPATHSLCAALGRPTYPHLGHCSCRCGRSTSRTAHGHRSLASCPEASPGPYPAGVAQRPKGAPHGGVIRRWSHGCSSRLSLCHLAGLRAPTRGQARLVSTQRVRLAAVRPGQDAQSTKTNLRHPAVAFRVQWQHVSGPGVVLLHD